ncbi:MAG: hypothetical protein J6X12_11855 [Paludibacteraceae bacterium]|nr:hypothetical protein [Paludibacteraceae bacterium]
MVNLRSIPDKELVRTLLDYQGEEFQTRLMEILRKTRFHEHPKVKNLHLADGAENERDYKNLVIGASKLLKKADDVWIITNYEGTTTADFIVKYGSLLKYMDLKIINSLNSLEQLISKHKNQARRFFIIVADAHCEAKNFAGKVKNCFIENERLSEIIISQRGKMLSIDRKTTESKDYYMWVKKQWKKKSVIKLSRFFWPHRINVGPHSNVNYVYGLSTWQN